MSLLFRLLAIAALSAGMARADFTPNDQQKNAIEHIAQVVAGSRVCDDWALNEKLAGALQISLGFYITDQATFDYIDERVTYHIERIQDRPRDDICAAIERLYGPDGENVQSLAVLVRT